LRCMAVGTGFATTDVVLAVIESRSDRLVGFARALTDDVYFAMVLDVLVAADFQKRGLGGVLLDAVVAHPRLAVVQSLELVCQPDLIPLYRRWGFDNEVGSSSLMRRARRS
jgi:GNAT superfamily N-acetyltransferase